MTMPLGMYELNRMTRETMEEERGMKRRRVGGNWEARNHHEGVENVDEGMESLRTARKLSTIRYDSPFGSMERFPREDRRKSLPNFCDRFDSTLRLPLVSVEN